jgi:hypothetical protein
MCRMAVYIAFDPEPRTGRGLTRVGIKMIMGRELQRLNLEEQEVEGRDIPADMTPHEVRAMIEFLSDGCGYDVEPTHDGFVSICTFDPDPATGSCGGDVTHSNATGLYTVVWLESRWPLSAKALAAYVAAGVCP